jgi:hypothetical protein
MTTRTRRGTARFTLSGYSSEVEEFVASLAEAEYRQLAGLDPEIRLEEVYGRHAGLFDAAAIERLRDLAGGAADDAAQARALLAFAVREHLSSRVAGLTERILSSEASAVVMWRGEAIPYRSVWHRATEIGNRAERNALAASYLEAVEAINPLRSERLMRVNQAVGELGYESVPAMVRETSGFDPRELASEQRTFLAESETAYYAALRRHLAEIDIEQGDAARVDLDRVLRGAGWDSWFPARGMLPALRRTLAGMGIDLDQQSTITLDLEHRPRKSPRAFCAPVRVPGDVRLVLQPRGGWDDYAALLHEGGHAEHFAHVAPDLPAAFRLLGDDSLTEGYGLLFELLLGDPAWLMEHLGMPEMEALAFADFHAFWELSAMRWLAAELLYELHLYSGADDAIAREQYAGLLGLNLGVRVAPEEYLATTDDALYVARYARATMVAADLAAWLRARCGDAWWRSADAGEALRRSWSRGQQWNAEDVVAHLGYDRLDWRPVLRQIRTRLIGEMSGYGGPNITTRAGTRKV